MPKPAKGPRLGGSASHERLMLANLVCALVEHKAITTTEHRAKRVQPLAEKLISKAKRGDLHARRTVLANLRRKDIVAELFEDLAPQFAGRDGGYTRITKIANRKGDNAPMVVLELVLEPVKPSAKKTAPKKSAAKASPKVAEETAVDEAMAEVDDISVETAATEASVDAPAPDTVDDVEVAPAEDAVDEDAAKTADTAAEDAATTED